MADNQETKADTPVETKAETPAENSKGGPSDEVPSADVVQEIQDYEVLDREGKPHAFKSLWSGDGATRKVLVIFIRHFYCGVRSSSPLCPYFQHSQADLPQSCQDYVTALGEAVTPDNLPPDTSVVYVGCGDPGLIDQYVEQTGCRFGVYADPTRRLFSKLGLIETWDAGSVAPAYQRHSIPRMALAGMVSMLGNVTRGLAHRGGDPRQVGGEFLFDGHVVRWCHRMGNTRDHTDVPRIRELLGVVIP